MPRWSFLLRYLLVTIGIQTSNAGNFSFIADGDSSTIPANRWVMIHQEDNSGGKRFSKAIWAENVNRLYLWGTGGKKPARNVYSRYEFESFDPTTPSSLPAFPETKRKSVVGGRLKGPGMRWRPYGTTAICQLRVLYKSTDCLWDQYWRTSVS